MTGSKLKLFVIFDILIAVVIAVLVGFIFHQKAEEKRAAEAAAEAEESADTGDESDVTADVSMPDITYDGQTYRYNTDIETYLIMGIDREDIEDTTGGTDLANNAGQSDVNLLVIIDGATDSVKLLPLSRDTRARVEYYNADGTYIDTAERNLCLQYAYGGGGQKSAELQTKAVSTLLYGIPVTGYAAVDMGSISTINDAVGGVTLTAAETIDGFCEKGEEITLHGDDAETYVRSRDCSRNYTNAERMNRQKSYFTAYLDKLHSILKQDMSIPFVIWSALSDHMVTNLESDGFSSLVNRVAKAGVTEDSYLEEPGELTHNDTTQHDEFYVDDSALYKLVVETFYKPVN